MNKLDELENRSIYIIREAYSHFEKIAAMWSMGKDSTVLLALSRKAFPGTIPFPVIHIDTGKKFECMYAFREKWTRLWNLNLIVAKNTSKAAKKINHTDKLSCCSLLKTEALKQVISQHNFDAIMLEPEGTTLYRIGSVAGEFLYYTVNPQIFCQKEEICLSYIRSVDQSKPWPTKSQHFKLGNAYINLETVVSHYCGMFYNKNSRFEPNHSLDLIETLNAMPEDSDEHHLAEIEFGAHYRGMMIAEQLFNDHPTGRFKPLVWLSFAEARERLLYITGIDVIDTDFQVQITG